MKIVFVAEIDGKIVGHIMFTKSKIGKNDVFVFPHFKGKEETELIQEDIKLQKLGFECYLELGSEFQILVVSL